MQKYIFSTALFPPIEYFAKLIQQDQIIIDPNEFYIKQTFRNRYEIAGPNSRQALSAHVIKGNRPKTPVKDVRMSYVEDWQSIHWKSIVTAYNTSPFFLYYQDEIEAFFKKEYNFLLDMNQEVLSGLMEIMGIETEVVYTEQYVEDCSKEMDLRNHFSPKNNHFNNPKYVQVFEESHGFMNNLSILDLLFNQGPDALFYLETIDQK